MEKQNFELSMEQLKALPEREQVDASLHIKFAVMTHIVASIWKVMEVHELVKEESYSRLVREAEQALSDETGVPIDHIRYLTELGSSKAGGDGEKA